MELPSLFTGAGFGAITELGDDGGFTGACGASGFLLLPHIRPSSASLNLQLK
jgi:hypothetical protein